MRRRVEEHVPAGRGRPAAQARPGRPARRRVRGAAAAARARPRRRGAAQPAPPSTALAALAAGGYVGRDDAAELGRGVPVPARARAPHPAAPAAPHPPRCRRPSADLRRLGRGARACASEPAERARRAAGGGTPREVRRLHEKLFYRPLLAAVARLSGEEARLTPEAARERLAALGYADPRRRAAAHRGADRGRRRRAAIQRQLLPVHARLVRRRRRPRRRAARRSARSATRSGTTTGTCGCCATRARRPSGWPALLARQPVRADLLAAAPRRRSRCSPTTPSCGRARATPLLRRDAAAACGRHDDAGRRRRSRRPRRRAAASCSASPSPTCSGCSTSTPSAQALTDIDRGHPRGGAARRRAGRSRRAAGGPLPTRLADRRDGPARRRTSWATAPTPTSLFVHDPLAGRRRAGGRRRSARGGERAAAAAALPRPRPDLEVDADLRPEGRHGPLVRSLASYAAYYARWSLVWEARRCCGRARWPATPGSASGSSR